MVKLNEGWRCLAVLLFLLGLAPRVNAQDTEPRRWTQMPTGLNFLSIVATYEDGEIFLDPVLLAKDVKYELAGVGLAYIRSFGLFGKSARFDATVPYASGRWEGLVDGELVSIRRRGFGDPRLRLSMLLYGGPAETPAEFAKSEKANTVVGAAVALTMPYGHYLEDKLINLGGNRWIVRPQLGVTHTRGKWTMELTGSVFIYSDNNEFLESNNLEADPLYAMQGHLIYTFRPGLWTSVSTAYGWGAEAAINGTVLDNPTGNWLTALSVGLPISRTQGIKLTWLRARTQKDTGRDFDSLILAYSLMF